MRSQEERKQVAGIILNQLGAKKFIMMTGSKNFLYGNNDLRMDLTRNNAGANRLLITLEADDTYTMYFYKGRICKKTFDYLVTKEQTFSGVYADSLQSIFTEVTGLYTRL